MKNQLIFLKVTVSLEIKVYTACLDTILSQNFIYIFFFFDGAL